MATNLVRMLFLFAVCGAIVAIAPGPAAAQRGVFAPPAESIEGREEIPAEKLIGREVRNARNETIGEIKSVALGRDGRVQAVIVGVGGFLSLGEREVAIGWDRLRIRGNGELIQTDLTKEQLLTLPEYKYADARQRGRVFASDARDAQSADKTQPPMTHAAWNMRASELIGMDVHNAQNETIGQVKDLVLDMRGNIQAVVVSVGGFLGLGNRDVAVGWKQFQFNREKRGIVASVALSKDQLKALPEYKLPRR